MWKQKLIFAGNWFIYVLIINWEASEPSSKGNKWCPARVAKRSKEVDDIRAKFLKAGDAGNTFSQKIVFSLRKKIGCLTWKCKKKLLIDFYSLFLNLHFFFFYNLAQFVVHKCLDYIIVTQKKIILERLHPQVSALAQHQNFHRLVQN